MLGTHTPVCTMLQVGTTNEQTRLDWVKSTLKLLPAGNRILDAGAGQCYFRPFCDHLIYVSQDFGQYTGEGSIGLQTGSWDNSKLDVVSDIASIPLPDQSFDAIMCTEVFEHIPNPLAAIAEFSRLLKPGGRLILTAPFASLTHFAPYHFASGLSRFFYEHHLPLNRFKIDEMTFNGNFFEFVAQETRRIDGTAKKYARSQLTQVERLIITLSLRILQRLSISDHGSSELLCFGIHVLATKA